MDLQRFGLAVFMIVLVSGWCGQAEVSPPASLIQQLFVRGETALRAGDLDVAEKAFREVAAQDPQMAGAYANLGVIAMRRRRWTEALPLLEKAHRLAPSVAGIQLNIGLAYFRQNDFLAAIAPFKAAAKGLPESIQARYLLGLCYFFTDDPASAVEALEPLWLQQSANLSYLYVVSNAAGQAGRKDLEQKALLQFAAIGQNSAELHLFLGKAHLNHQEYELAISELRRSAVMNPELPFVHFNLGLAYLHTSHFEDARDEFLKDVRVEPEVAFNYDQLGATYMHLEQYREAEKSFQASVQRDPRLVSSRFGLAKIYNQDGKYQAALRELDLALKVDPKNSNLHYLRGRVLLRLNRKPEAESELKIAGRLIKEQRERQQDEFSGKLPHPELTDVP